MRLLLRRLLPALAGLAALHAPARAFERAAPPAPSAQACPEHGAGFVRIPGTTTCLRVSGRASAGADAGGGPRATDPVSGRLAIDTRTETGYGPARTYTRIGSDRPFPR